MGFRLKFGGKLNTLRRGKKWSISRAAKSSGLTDDQWEALEAALHEPLAGRLIRAVNGLGCSMDVFDPEDFDRCAQ
jgi:hypothetical protein